MTKFKKILSTMLVASVALVLTAGFACLSINCSSEESAAKAGKTVYADPVAYPAVYMNEYNTLAEAVTANLSDTEAGQIALTLTEDYRFSSGEAGVEIPEGKYITVDLNGHSIDVSGSSTGRAFEMYGTLTLTDSTGYYTAYDVTDGVGVYDNGNGTFTTVYEMSDETVYYENDGYKSYMHSYTSGAVYGANNTSCGGTVYLSAGGTFIMDGGTITGNTHSKGGGILSEGTSSSRNTLVINGGSVSGNSSTGSGAGIFVEYTDMDVHGGIISSNKTGSSYHGGGMYIMSESAFYMDEGESIPTVVSHNTAKNGSAIFLYTSGTSGEIAGGHIEFNTSTSNAGIQVDSGVIFTLSGGFIAHNTAPNSGAGIYIYTEATMTGGIVYNNEITGSNYGGGGIMVNNSGKTFTMTGGKIIDNVSKGNGGGVDVYTSSYFVMTGGEILGNTCKNWGAGVYLYQKSTATIENSTISGNSATANGGGAVHVSSGNTCTLTNVTMENNYAPNYGGAVDVRGTMTMTGCVISGNETGGSGGGLYETGTVTMSDTVITGNSAGTDAGGVYVGGTLSISGEIIVKDNLCKGEKVNVLLTKDKYITLDGALSSGSYIGLTIANSSQTQVTTAETTTERYKTAGQCFVLDNDSLGYFVGYKSGDNFLQLMDGDDAAVEVTWTNGENTRYFDTLEGALDVAASDDADSQGTAKLRHDVDVSSTITIEAGTYAALDLNGCTVTWTGASKSNFFMVYGNFTLKDSRAAGGEYEPGYEPGVYKYETGSGTQYATIYGVMDGNGSTSYYYYVSGAITGGMATGSTGNNINSRGGAFYVGAGATMDMYGGTLYGNTGTYAGAVHNYGTFTMYGGSVSGNYSQNSSTKHNGAAFLNDTGTLYLLGGVLYGNQTTGTGYGGAVENANVLYMYKLDGNDDDFAGLGPVITGNYSSNYGGAVFNSSTFYLYDGYLTLNEVKTDGGGINNNGGPTYMHGGYVTGNTAGAIGGGVCSPSSFYMYGGCINCNTAGSYAGGIYTGSTSYFYSGEIAGNTTSKYGGGISTISTLYVGGAGDDSGYSGSMEISGNTASTYGGGIYSTSNLYIYGGAEISGNTASDLGGGVYGTSKIYIYGGEISGNTAKNYGGGVYASSSSTLEMTGGEISGNKVTGSQSQGGGMAVYGTGTMSGGKITGNTAAYYGGAVYIEKGTFTMSGEAELSENSATRAGAVSVSGKNATFYMNGGTIANNSATTGNGGGVYAGNSGTYFTMTDGEISGNTAADCAGGLFCNSNSTVKLLGGTIEGNYAKNSGAGVYYVSSASLEIGGGLTVEGNYKGTSESDKTSGNENNFYVLSGTKITVDEDFNGTVYLYAEAAPSLQLSANTITRDDFVGREMSKHLLSDQGYCVGFNSANSYIYIYENHDYSIIYVGLGDVENSIISTHYCSQCFIKGYECGAEDSGCQADIRYLPDENGHATAYVDETGCTCYGIGASGEDEEGGLYLDYGAILDDGQGNVTWYPDLASAFAAATCGDCEYTITLLEDITIGDGGSLGIADSANITLDLNGHTVDGNVNVSGSGQLTIADSVGTGEVTGTISGAQSATVTISASGGTYKDITGIGLADGYYFLDNGDGTYTVYDEEEIENHAVAYIEAATGAEPSRMYYVTLDDAVRNATEANTVTLCNNIDISTETSISIEKSVTIDLAGYTLAADFSISAGDFTGGTTSETPVGQLKITDSSKDVTGRISGTITVEGSSDDQDEAGTNSFAETLTIVATAVDPALYVDLENLTSSGTSVEYSFSALTGDEGTFDSYGIVKGHEHYWTIAEAYEDESGAIKIRIKCSCGEYYTVASEPDGTKIEEFDLPEGAVVEAVENGDGTVTYYITDIALTDDSGEAIGVGTFTADYTTEPLVKIEYTDEESNAVVVYLDENTIGSINDVLGTEGAANFTITLWTDVNLGEVLGENESLEISGEDVTIDLNGHALSGNLEISSASDDSSSLTVTDSSAVAYDGDDDDEVAVAGTGTFDCAVSVGGNSAGTNEITISGGTYSAEAATSIEEAFGKGFDELVSEGYVAVHNADGSVTVVETNLAGSEAAVVVTVGETEMYFESLRDAVDYAKTQSGATIKLLDDYVCADGETLEISGNITIDLNGSTIYGDIEVADDATLDLEDETGEGRVEGRITAVDTGSVTGIVVAEIEDTDGNKFYYTDLETALSDLADGDILVILTDLGSEEAPVYINVTVEGSVTLDLGGNTVYADVTSSDVTSLTIENTSEGETGDGAGILAGSVSGSDITIVSGTYTQNVGAYVSDDKVKLVVTDENGTVTYVVVGGDDERLETAAASVTDENGNVTYYTSLETAVSSVVFGDTLTLLDDVDADSLEKLDITDAGVFTIDLNGHTISSDVTISGNTSLTITDSKEYKDAYVEIGGISGTITVEGDGATLTVEAGVYSSDVTGYEAEGKVVLVIHDDAEETNSYMVLSEDEAKEAAVASVTYTDADGNERTVYFDEVSDAVACACENSASESPATVVLYKDVGEDNNIEITAGNVILDMNGYTVNSDISISDEACGGASLRITGEGSYGGDTDISGYLDDGLAIYVTENGTLIVDEEYAKVNASVAVTVGDTTIYFDDIYAAVEYVNGLEDGETVVLTLLEDVAFEDTEDTIIFTNDVAFDLNGHTFAGNVQAGDGTNAASVVIEDSSAEGGKGEGLLDGTVATGTANGSSVAVTGGTFTDGGVQNLVGEGCVAVIDADGHTVVVSSSELEKVASASVTTDGGTTYTYYESLDMAIAAVATLGGTVQILKDAEMTGDAVTITSSVAIDLNGHTAGVNLTVDADGSGTLNVCDIAASADCSDAGTITGTIAVTGSSDGASAAENPYESALTMSGGVAPNGNLTIDLSGLGTDVEYFFDAVYDGDTLTGYGIVKDHVHDYVIEVWTFTEGGGFTLDYMCACGEMWQQDSVVAKVTVAIDEDGNYVFTAIVYDDAGNVVATTEYTADIVASVTVDGETYYFETLEAALNFTATVSGSTLTLQKDCDEVANVIGNVTIDLNGHDIGGIAAENGSSVTVAGEGYVSSLDVGEYASVRLQGGTYGTDELVDVETYVDRYNGYAVYVDAEGNVSVVSENYAVMNSAASVTDSDGNVTYYETLGDAVEALGGGETLTLYSDASDKTITIDKENITIDLNNSNLGGLVVEDGASAAITGNGTVGSIDADGDLDIRGGTYGADDLAELEKHIDSDYAILVGSGGSYTVLSGDDAEERSVVGVTFTDGDEAVTLYFEDMQTALAFAAEVGGTATLTSDYSGDISLVGDMTLDLAGHTVEGDIEVADGVSATICDSVGSGVVTGEIVAGDDSTVSITGGTYYDEEVESYVADGYVAVAGYDEGGNAVYTVMTESEAVESAAACVEFADGTVGYYESAADAIAAATENGGNITLLDDVDLGDTEYTITNGLVIDLNGHTIYGNLVVDTDVGGSLEVVDSSEDNSGSMEGTIKVTGSGKTEYTDNPYENALVFSDGATPNGNLTIDLDALADADNETSYVFAETNDGEYAIISHDDHEHSYNIAVWEYDYETGTVTVKFMCACGAYEDADEDGEGDEHTIDKSEVTVEMNGDGAATVKCSYEKDGVTYDCVMTINVEASVAGEDGETYYFETFDEALGYACETNGTIVLNDDVTDATIAVGDAENDGFCDVTIDLAGHTLEGSVSVSEGSTLRVTDSSEDGTGLLEAALEVNGTLIVDGASLVLTESSTVGDGGEIIFTGDSSVDLDGNTLTGVTGIDGNLDVTGGTGSKIVLADDVEIPEGSSLGVDGDLTIDVNGNDFAGDINVSDGSSLTIIDSTGANSGSYEGTITLGEDSYLMMENDTYSEDAEIVYPEGMVMQSTTGSDGEPAYEVVSESDHVGKGHGLDKVKDYTFNAETSTITIEFECMCGETIYRTVPVTEADYTTTVVEVDGVKMVRVEYSLTSTEQGDNGTTYSYSVSGCVDIDMYIEGVDGNNYSYAVGRYSDCTTEGEDVYTYGNGKGVVVRVATPRDHRYGSEPTGYVTINGVSYPYYKCVSCDKYVLDVEGALYEYESGAALEADANAQNTFENSKSEILDQLRDEIDSLLSDLAKSLGEDSNEYKAAAEAVEEVYNEYENIIKNTGYEATSGSDEDIQSYLDELGSVLNDTLVDATQTSYEVSTEYIIDALYQELLESGRYEGSALDSLNDVFDELVSDLGKITVGGLDDIKDFYETFNERARAALEGVTPSTALTSEDSEVAGSVQSSEGVSASVEFVIESKDATGAYVDADEFVYVGEYDYTEEDIAALTEGKGVAAVFDISLYDTSAGSFIYRYKGTYIVSIKLDDTLLGLSGLQVIYVGSDGKAEVYDTYVTDDGYLVFTTTHFSEFLILSSDVEGNEPPAATDGGTSSETKKTSDGVPVEIIITLCIIAAGALAIILIMCCSFKPGKKEDE